MRRIKIALLGLFLILLPSAASAETEWFYSSLSDPLMHQIIISPTHVGGHLQAGAKTCSSEEPFLCYASKGFQFAVPKVLDGHQEWMLDGAKYRIKKIDNLSLLGKSISVIWIDQTTKKTRLRFLYSKTQGLIGFISLKPKGPLFLLENGCGFAASAECVD
jgi:hypothetical protein